MNAVVRGDVNHIRIGRRTNIQDGVVVHVMRDPSHPTIRRRRHHRRARRGRARVHGRGPLPHRHGRDPAQRLVTSGQGSIVAAGTLLPEGVAIPPRSLVMGSPGKVRRAD